MNEQLNMNEQLGLMNPSKSKSKTPNLDKIKEALVLRPAKSLDEQLGDLDDLDRERLIKQVKILRVFKQPKDTLKQHVASVYPNMDDSRQKLYVDVLREIEPNDEA